MKKHRLPLSLQYLLFGAVLIMGFIFSLSIGAKSEISFSTILSLLSANDLSLAQKVIVDIRMPRVTAALFLGINLSLAGLSLQAVTRNKLASPSILGINQGASLAIALGLVFPHLLPVNHQLLALLGACGGGFLTFALAGGLTGKMSSLRLVLSGVAVGAFVIALVRFVFLLEDNLARQIIQWTAGDISGLRWSKMRHLGLWSLFGVIFFATQAHRYNLLALGDAASKGLGIDPRKTQLAGALVSGLLTGSCVAVSGPIVFVGLVIPHIAQSLVGADYKKLVPATVLIGGALMVVADGASKLIHFPYETPIGVICALVGAPYFIYQIITAKDTGA